MAEHKKAVLILLDCQPDLYKIIKDDKINSKEIYTYSAHFEKNKTFFDEIKIIDVDHDRKKILNKKAEKELNSFTLIERNGKSIMDELKFENAYIWYYHRFRIYFKLRNLLYSEELIKNLQERYEDLTVFTDDEYLAKKFNDFSNINVQISSIEGNNSNKKAGILKLGIQMILNGVSALFSKKMRAFKHLIIVNSENGNPGYSDDGAFNRYYVNLLKQGDPDDYAVLDLSIMPKPGQQRNVNLDIYKTTKYPIISSDSIWFRSTNSIKKYRKKINLFVSHISCLNEQWKDSLLDIQSWILKEMIMLNGSTRLYLLQYLIFQSYFKNSSLRTVITISEHSSNERSILDAAKSAELKTVGIQHGVIGPSNISYNFLDNESKYHPIPDITIVWGDKWREFLTEKSCYTEENTITLGQLRTDLVNKYQSLRKIDLEHSFPEDKKWILFASQPQKDENLRRQAAVDIIDAIKDKSDQFLIIKIHPAEKKIYYQEILDKQQASNCVVVSEEADLYNLLATCDLVITCFSTVGGEATFFNKPIITYDPLKEDIAHYYEHNIAEQVTNASELKTVINNILEGTADRTIHYKEYIKNHVHKVDGQTTQRYLDAIAKL